jgi:hypothetical protein
MVPLRKCELIDYPDNQRAGQNSQPDFFLTATQNGDEWPCMVVEVESTHRLALPMLATDVVRVYDDGPGNYAQRVRAQRVRNPIGQILRYMVLNEVRFGALTSGTRTYFFPYRRRWKSSCRKSFCE